MTWLTVNMTVMESVCLDLCQEELLCTAIESGWTGSTAGAQGNANQQRQVVMEEKKEEWKREI